MSNEDCDNIEYKDSQLVKMVKPVATIPISLLVESLVKNLCTMIETDKERALKIYNIICTKLFEMKLIDESYRMNEFEGVRNQYQEALYHLVTVARGGEEPLAVKRVWSSEEMNFGCSHYHREFDEIEYIAGGGFGQVFRVRHKLDGTEYAIKKICIRSSGIDSVMNYLAEVKTFASLNHSNIVQYKAAWLELGKSSNNAIESVSELSDDSYNTSLWKNSDKYIYPDMINDMESERLSLPENSSGFTIKFEDTDSTQFKQYSYSNNNIHNARSLRKDRGSRNSISEGGQSICKFDINKFGHQQHKPQWATLYIQMALCQITLKQWLDNRNISDMHDCNQIVALKSVRTNTIIEILQQLLRGIQYIHSRSIVHHDIKPSNIFIQIEAGALCVQLGDFGLACPLQSAKHSLAFGTKLYAAPEQLKGNCNPKSDMYSLGIVLLELVETFSTDMERVHHISALRKGHLSAYVSAKEPQLAHIISQLVSRYPHIRPNASELLEKLTVHPDDSEQVRNLKSQLAEKDSEINRLKEMLKLAGVDLA